jgi:hypothetical protein
MIGDLTSIQSMIEINAYHVISDQTQGHDGNFNCGKGMSQRPSTLNLQIAAPFLLHAPDPRFFASPSPAQGKLYLHA